MNRKEFLKKTTALGLGATLYPKIKDTKKPKKEVVHLAADYACSAIMSTANLD